MLSPAETHLFLDGNVQKSLVQNTDMSIKVTNTSVNCSNCSYQSSTGSSVGCTFPFLAATFPSTLGWGLEPNA